MLNFSSRRASLDAGWERFAEIVGERVRISAVGVTRRRSCSLRGGRVQREEMQLRYDATVDVLRELSCGEDVDG